MIENISPQELLNRFQNNNSIRIIDVRTPVEFSTLHVQSAENMPLDRLDPASLASNPGKDGFLYFICQSGGRSKQACNAMCTAGFEKVINIEGGTIACEAAGLPVVRGRKAISLERQVRIAAGLLVFAGVLLAAFGGINEIQLAGLCLAGFIGAGLVFAGLTDTCGMAMIIAKMPWNQSPSSGNTCKTTLFLMVFLVGIAAPVLAGNHTKDSLAKVKHDVLNQDAILIDVREPKEWSHGHLSLAQSLPLSELQTTAKNNLHDRLPSNKIIYCHCLSGGRCLEAARILSSHGYDARALQPGYPDLIDAGFTQADSE